jgi:hypothetical protein
MDKVNSGVVRKHLNDCWCTSISKALNVDYDKVYKDFKLFKEDNGGAHIQVIRAYLMNKGYECINVDLDLKTALNVYNTTKKAQALFSLVSEDTGHIIYVKNEVIYDDIKDFEYDEYIKAYKVDKVFVKKG